MMSIEIELAAPVFLVAVPQMADPSFSRCVVFVMEHNEKGSMGLIINKQGELDMDGFCRSQEMKFTHDGATSFVFKGGPVQPERAFILHSSNHAGPETEHIVGGVRLSYSLESLGLLAADPPSCFRVYLGYTGWGLGQLADEIQTGAWLLAAPEPELVFHRAPNEVWEATLRRMGIEPALLMHSGVIH